MSQFLIEFIGKRDIGALGGYIYGRSGYRMNDDGHHEVLKRAYGTISAY